MPKDNGSKQVTTTSEESGKPTGMARRIRQPLFERELLEAGRTIAESMTRGIFRDEQALNIACLYIDHLERMGLTDEIQTALYKLNGTMAIGGRARKEAVMAHGDLYFPDDASKEDKKNLAKMQYKYRKDEDGKEGVGQKE